MMRSDMSGTEARAGLRKPRLQHQRQGALRLVPKRRTGLKEFPLFRLWRRSFLSKKGGYRWKPCSGWNGDTRSPNAYPGPRSQLDVSREVAPHFAASFGNVFFRNVDVQVCPEPFQAAQRLQIGRA